MNFKSKKCLTGHVKLYAGDFDSYDDFLKSDREKYLVDDGSNLVVDGGMERVINLMTGTSSISWTLCAVGSGTNTPVSTDTALQTQIGTNTINDRYRVSLDAYYYTFFGKNDDNGTWNETALLTSDGNMLCRRLLSATFIKDTTKAAVVSWKIGLTAVAD